MTTEINPFVRGYCHLEIHRVLIVSYDDDNATFYCQVHPSQTHLSDDELDRSTCILNSKYALAIDPDQASRSQQKEFQQEGIVRAVLRRLISEDSGDRSVVGYAFDDQMAEQMVKCMSSSAGSFSRSCEVSSAHLPPASLDYLEQMARGRKPGGLFFEAFKIPTSDAVGVKLVGTPWSDESLRQREGITANALRESHLVAGIPEALVNVLHLAAEAGTRLLIFDPDAPVLDCLAVFND